MFTQVLIFTVCLLTTAAALPADYQTLAAQDKQDILYAECFKTSDSQGSYASIIDLIKLMQRDVNPSFDHASDEMPYKNGKPIHEIGYVTKAKFEATNNHPFTGVFTGSPYVLMRLSLAAKPEKGITQPGLAVKFLRSSIRSGNFVAMYSLEGQASDDFFANDFQNHVAPPTSDKLKKIVTKFKTASDTPTHIGLSDLAAYDLNGQSIQQAVFPFLLVLKPNPTLSMTVDQLTSIPINTKLYDVWAQAEPQDKELIRIGAFITTSEFIGTKYGDDKLFFQHQRMEDDFVLKPEWKGQISAETCPFSK